MSKYQKKIRSKLKKNRSPDAISSKKDKSDNLLESLRYFGYKEKSKESPEQVLMKIKKNIEELYLFFENFDPIDILNYLSLEFLKFNPETETEINSNWKGYAVEYILSIATSINNPGKKSVSDQIDKIKDLVISIINDTIFYYIVEPKPKYVSAIDKSIRFQLILNTLRVRGDGYGPHLIEMVENIYTPQNHNLINELGLSIQDIIQIINNIKKQIQSTENAKNPIFKAHQEHRLGLIDQSQLDLILLSHKVTTRAKFDELFREFSIFRIKPENEKAEIFYELLSSSYGSNGSFVQNDSYPSFIKGWPLNDTILQSKPLFKDNKGRYYGFCVSYLIGKLYDIIYMNLSLGLREKVDKSKSDYLEKMITKYFERIFPDDVIYTNLYYTVTENGIQKRVECDGLIVFDDKILLIEAKSKKLKPSVRRGSIVQFKRSIDKIVNAAYEQALRTKKFITSNKTAEFYDENGNLVITINSKEIENYYLINLTSELLAPISTQLHLLKNFNLIQDKDWIWSVYVNDLRIISELIESPSEFILYIERRLELNNLKIVYAPDEIDYFGYFLDSGFNFSEKIYENDNNVLIGYGQKIDDYYYHKFGLRSTGPKPQFRIEQDYWDIIRYLEKNRRPHFSIVTLALLKINSTEIIAIFEKINNISASNNRYSNAFLTYDDIDLGINLSIRPSNQDLDLTTELGYIGLRKYKHKLTKVIFLAGQYENGKLKFDYGLVECKWVFNSDMEEQMSKMRIPDLSRKI